MLFSFESPLCLLPLSRVYNDYDYCLAHLLCSNEVYREFFFESKELGRVIFLDNSVFELGKPYTSKRYLKWVDELEPDYYILPDSMEDCKKTIRSSLNFLPKVKGSSKPMGVVQGKDYAEYKECYEALEPHCAMLAFPKIMAYRKVGLHLGARQEIITKLLEEGVINVNKPHHLLGCVLPQEGSLLKDLSFIYSQDTSCPIIATMQRRTIEKETGLPEPLKGKVAFMMDCKADQIERGLLNRNISAYKNLW